MPDTEPVEPTGPDAAREALARARRAARERPPAPPARGTGGGTPRRGGSDSRDPVLLGQSVRDLVAERGWAGPTAVAGVVGRWPEIVGAQIAEHVQPEGFDVAAGRLLLRADSTAWATVMGYEVARVKERISQEVGPGVVRHVTVVGPTAPSWRHGSRSVPGRGPRDTYG